MSDKDRIVIPSDEELKRYGGAADKSAETSGDEKRPATEAQPADAAKAETPKAAEESAREEDAEADPLAGLTDDEVKALARESDALRETAQRAVAELANFRKRTMRDKPREALLARRDVLIPVVEALSDLAKALDAAEHAASAPEAAKALVEGVRITRDQLMKRLETYDFKPIPGVGSPFDPAVHEAIRMVETDDANPGTVMDMAREGYMLGDVVVRTAQVTVAQPASPKAKQEDGKQKNGEPGGQAKS